jgi:hypothetical protein
LPLCITELIGRSREETRVLDLFALGCGEQVRHAHVDTDCTARLREWFGRDVIAGEDDVPAFALALDGESSPTDSRPLGNSTVSTCPTPLNRG